MAHRRKSAAYLKPITDTVVDSNGAGEEEEEEELNQVVEYDHTQCNDCGCVHTMVTECVMQLAAKTLQVRVAYGYICSRVNNRCFTQAEEGTRRLQRVLELQVKMSDARALAEEFE
jgi:hypothetical protein